jgi:Ni,Fe-hydrogenase III small subunit
LLLICAQTNDFIDSIEKELTRMRRPGVLLLAGTCATTGGPLEYERCASTKRIERLGVPIHEITGCPPDKHNIVENLKQIASRPDAVQVHS